MFRHALCLICTLLVAAAPAAVASDPDHGAAAPGLGGAQDRSLGGVLGAVFPALSPDGARLAFSMHGDLWVVPAEGGYARRITLSEAYDTKPRWSPDGKTIAFSSKRSGNYDLWVVAPEKGAPRRLTFDYAFDSISDWSRDGRYLYFHSNRDGRMNVWRIPAGGGLAEQMTLTGGRDAAADPAGERLLFSYGLADLSRKGYRGSSNWDLYLLDRPGGAPRPVTAFEGNDRWPLFTPDGKHCVYLSEKKGWYNLYRLDLATGEEKAVTRHQGDDVRTPFLSYDGTVVVYVLRDALWRTELATGRTAQIPFTVNADLKGPAYVQRTVTEGAEQPSWSPDGLHVAFQLRGDIWVMPASGGKARQVTSGPAQDQWPVFSPDGGRIAFFSDRSGNKDLWIVPASGGKAEQITTHEADDYFHHWSPDGRKLVFCSLRSGNKDIWIVDLASRSFSQLTRHPKADDDPVFSPCGRYIAFDSGRTGSQNIYVVPAGGGRLRRVTRGRFDQVATRSPDSSCLAYENHDVEGRPPSVWVVRADGSCRMQVTSHGSCPRWAPRGQTLVFERQDGEKKLLYTAEAPANLEPGLPLTFVAVTEVDQLAERLQAFEEAWRLIRDSFYDEKMHGVDWKAVRKKYLTLARDLRTDEELIGLINRMLGELKASHMGFWGRTPRVRKPDPPTGYLGLRMARTGDGPGLSVLEILPGGPADKVWVREGDRVLAINGRPLGPKTNVARLLSGTVGKTVALRVGPGADPSKPRTVGVKPVDWRTMRALSYRRWVRERAAIVRKATDGKVGYLHLRMMGDSDLEHFKKAVAGPLAKTEALVLDVRNNGGGHIHGDLLDILTRRPFGAYHPRGGKRTVQPRLYYTKPVVVLVNEKSFSDAEVFPHGFQALGRGKVVGVPTNGGVIGTGSATLINGFTLRLPRVGWYSLDGKNLEGRGVQPDIVVEETMEDRLHDRDPQLRKAIEVVLEELRGGKAPETGPPSGGGADEAREEGDEFGRR